MLILDGIQYDVDYTAHGYKATAAWKYEYISADGQKHGEKLGSYREYTLGIGNRPSGVIDRLAEHFSDPNSYHVIELYDGPSPSQLKAMEIMVDSVQKNIQSVDDDGDELHYEPLTVTFHTRRAVL